MYSHNTLDLLSPSTSSVKSLMPSSSLVFSRTNCCCSVDSMSFSSRAAATSLRASFSFLWGTNEENNLQGKYEIVFFLESNQLPISYNFYYENNIDIARTFFASLSRPGLPNLCFIKLPRLLILFSCTPSYFISFIYEKCRSSWNSSKIITLVTSV